MYHSLRPALLAVALSLLLAAALPVAAQGAADVTRPVLPDATAFRAQMEVGNVDKARAWLAAGLDPDFLGDRIGSGLMIGAWEGNVPLMEVFAERGADVNLANPLGETALMHAAWKGRSEAVRWLLARGARVESAPMQWSVLHYAAFAGNNDIVKLLVDHGADINARSPNGSSVLMMAIYEGRESTARWLLAHGADTGVKNENGDGALEWAMKFNRGKIARMVAETPEAFRTAAAKPKVDWGVPLKSEPVPKDIEELLVMREILAARGMSVERVDRRIAALRARYARESLGREAPPAAVLEITAQRNAPARQNVRMVRRAPGEK